MKKKLFYPLLLVILFSYSCSLTSTKKSEPKSSDVFGGLANRNVSSSNFRQGTNYKFPMELKLPDGFTQPLPSQDQLSSNTRSFYEKWANLSGNDGYLMINGYEADGNYYTYVRSDTTGNVTKYTGYASCSEAHGFGMMILAIMDDGDSSNIDEKKEFDSMFKLSRKFRWKRKETDGYTHLMSWALPLDYSEFKAVDTDKNDSVSPATDGDSTIAYALLLADKQWGSNGTINYLAEAIKIIDHIAEYQIKEYSPGDYMPNLGHPYWDGYDYGSRPSDWMIDFYMEFYHATGEEKFKQVAENIIKHMDAIQNWDGNTSNLIPDFVVYDIDTNEFKPVPLDKVNPVTKTPYYAETEHDISYYYNASRIPYRLARAAALYPELKYNNTSIKDILHKINDFIESKYSDGDIKTGLKLNGEVIHSDYSHNAFISSFAAGQIVNKSNDYSANNLYNQVTTFTGWDHSPATWKGYFHDTVSLISQIIISGNWWGPSYEPVQEPTIKTIDYTVIEVSNGLSSYDDRDGLHDKDGRIVGFNKITNNLDTYIILDLQKQYHINYLEKSYIEAYNSELQKIVEYYPTKYSFSLSNDQFTWKSSADYNYTGGFFTLNNVDEILPDNKARYLKVTFKEANNLYIGLDQIIVRGK